MVERATLATEIMSSHVGSTQMVTESHLLGMMQESSFGQSMMGCALKTLMLTKAQFSLWISHHLVTF